MKSSKNREFIVTLSEMGFSEKSINKVLEKFQDLDNLQEAIDALLSESPPRVFDSINDKKLQEESKPENQKEESKLENQKEQEESKPENHTENPSNKPPENLPNEFSENSSNQTNESHIYNLTNTIMNHANSHVCFFF